jgi:putative spermidine/putrescine transport system substrate-binding protein
MFVLLAARIYGGSEDQTDVAFREIAKLKPFNQIDFSGAMEVQLSRGEVVVGPLDYAAVIRLQRRGVPIAGAVMKEGVFMFEQVFNVTKGSKNKELAYEWVNYVLSSSVQNKLVKDFYVSPVNLETAIPPDLKSEIMLSGDRLKEIIQFDWSEANKKRDALIERWNREMT